MRTSANYGNGINSVSVELTLVDAIALRGVHTTIDKVLRSHVEDDEYKALPYDKCYKENKNGAKVRIPEPKRLELSDEDMTNIAMFIHKCVKPFGEGAKSNIFEDEPENPQML